MGLVCFTARRQHAQFPGIPLPAKQLQPACGGAAALRWWSSCVDGAIAEEAPGYPRPHHMFVSCGRSQTRSAVSSLSERATPHLVTVEGRGRRACGYKVLLLFLKGLSSVMAPLSCVSCKRHQAALPHGVGFQWALRHGPLKRDPGGIVHHDMISCWFFTVLQLKVSVCTGEGQTPVRMPALTPL
jgi:hypothetical protein